MAPRSVQRILILVAAALFLVGIFSYKHTILQIVQDAQISTPLKPGVSTADTISFRDGSVARASLKSPMNSTLGFQTIQFINLDYRWDRDDSIVLQSAYTGIKPQKFIGVTPDDIHPKGISPVSNDIAQTNGHIACFRSHANLWSKMIQEEWTSMLVLEADATWDAQLKPIMRRFSAALHKLHQTSEPAVIKSGPTENDPYNSRNWDMISLGHCFDGFAFNDEYHIYSDEDAQENQGYFAKSLNNERVVRRSGGPACTTAYALSQSGAKKLLVRAALDMNKPVDLVISDLVSSGQLIAYSTHPVVFGQLAFRDGIGANELNSDVNDLKAESSDIFQPEYRQKWTQVYKDRSVWRPAEIYEGSKFRNPVYDLIGPAFFAGAPDVSEQGLWWPDQPDGSTVITVVEPPKESGTPATVVKSAEHEETSD